ncbi:MAG TPA: DNA replication complex GINS family protein [Methanocorpusculum sp.]|nr:DNA replication complex GINS family protein [Methanocorpusculum sp.]
MREITISDLHGFLLDERASGSLVEIPGDFYEVVLKNIEDLRKKAASTNDPFGEGVQSLIKERESLREYLRDLYSVRTKKIINLAQAKANGEEIDRNELRMMVSGERSLYQVVLESCESCRKTLLEGKPTLEITAYGYGAPEVPEIEDASPVNSENTPVQESALEYDAQSVSADSAEQAPEPSRVIAVRSEIQSFQDINGRVYTLSPGDIVSLPQPMADILCNTNKALSIRIRK